MRSADGEMRFRDDDLFRRRPVHLELLQPLSPLSGIWRDFGHDQFINLGCGPRTEPAIGRDASRGLRLETSLVDEDGSEPVIFVRCGRLLIELVSQDRRPRFEAWVSGTLDAPDEFNRRAVTQYCGG